MLAEYFGILIDESKGLLMTLPQVIDNHIPVMLKLPELLFSLCSEVDWTAEQVRLFLQSRATRHTTYIITLLLVVFFSK